MVKISTEGPFFLPRPLFQNQMIVVVKTCLIALYLVWNCRQHTAAISLDWSNLYQVFQHHQLVFNFHETALGRFNAVVDAVAVGKTVADPAVYQKLNLGCR